MFDAARFRSLARRRGLALGEPLDYQRVTASTNDSALAAARAGAPHGATFVAGAQSAGRGRRGHQWLSSPDENLLFSVLLRPSIEPPRVSALTLAVGLAVRDAVAPRLAGDPKLKWPNDLLLGDAKLAGILVESQLQGSVLRAVVVGVGLNVGAREFPPELAARATSLALAGATDLEQESLLVELLAAIDARVGAFEQTGVRGLLPELARADALLGRRVRVDAVAGHARGIDDEGRLLVEDATGRIVHVAAGSVEFS